MNNIVEIVFNVWLTISFVLLIFAVIAEVFFNHNHTGTEMPW